MKMAITTLRDALQHALDELHRVNAAHACVRPDVTYAAMEALRNTYLAPIENASEIERRIVGKLVTDLLAAGFAISVNDGEETTLEDSTDLAAICAAMGSTDSDNLYVSKPGLTPGRWILLVWGNDVDVISDYSMSLEPFIAPANDLAEALS